MSEDARLPVRVRPLGRARFLIETGATQRLAHAVHADGRTWIWCDGRQYVVADEGPDSRETGTDDAMLQAPMPARVRSVATANGRAVRAGDVLVVLEAMKMELSVRAPRDGTVRTVRCAVGDLVQPGVPLVELEP